MNDSRSLARMTLMAIGMLAVLLWLRETPKPHIGTVQYQFAGKEVHQTTHPFFINAEAEYLDVEFSMILTRWQSQRLRVKPDDCLEELFINDRKVEIAKIPYCDYSNPGTELDLSAYLEPGLNVWKMHLRDTGGKAGFRISPTLKGWVPLLDFAIVGLLIFYSFVLWKNFAYIRRLQGVFAVMVAGIALRVLYVLATPYMLRGHDTDGHEDFIRYVFENLKLPAAHAGWEYHQAPLYYMISAMTMKISAFFGIAESQLMGVIQVQSLLFGAGIVVVAGLLAMRLFPSPASKTERLLYCGIIAMLPAFVFLSSRITNNTLYMLLASLSFLLLIRWWKSNNVNDWFELCVILGLTTLTKASGLAIVAAAGVCWLLKNMMHRHMWRQAIVGGIITVLIVGWYPLSRISHPGDTEKLLTLGNGGMHSGLALENTAKNFLTFNPLGVLEHPFNNPWGDEQRRQNFWEYFYRSAYFGEFGFHDQLRILARSMLLFGMVGLVLMALGMIESLWKKNEDAVPAFVMFTFMLMAAFLYRYNFQYSANQDFRQSIVVILPATYFAMLGYALVQRSERWKWLKKGVFWALMFGILSNATFIMLLFWYR